MTEVGTESAKPFINYEQAREIVAIHGTPLMLFSRHELLRNVRTFQENLELVEICYAMKANPHGGVLFTLSQETNVCIDVCTAGEVRKAAEFGFSSEDMIHTHPCRRIGDAQACYEMGVRWFVFDSEYELSKLEVLGEHSLILRISTSSKSSRIDLSQKFGCDPSKALYLIETAENRGFSVKGISFHVGSQCTDPEDIRSALLITREVWEDAAMNGSELEVLDIGGGFPSPYTSPVMPLSEYCAAVSEAISDVFSGPECRVLAEPGRCLVSTAFLLLTRIIGKSKRGGMTWYIIDDGVYGSFSGVVYDHAEYPVFTDKLGPRRPCVVAGPTCDSSDVISRGVYLPDMDIGDLLLVPSMGAYTNASATGFNGIEETKILRWD